MPVTLVTAVTDDVCVTRKRARSRGLRRACYRCVSDRLRIKNGENINDFNAKSIDGRTMSLMKVISTTL